MSALLQDKAVVITGAAMGQGPPKATAATIDGCDLNRLGFLAAPISVTAPVVESTGERSTPPRIHPAGRIRDGCAGDCD